MRESCISHAPRSRFVALRKEYVDGCGGNGCAGALLAVFEFWTNVRLAEAEHAPRRRRRQITLNGTRAPWVFRSREDLVEDLCGVWKVRAIDSAIKVLISEGYLERRHNPDAGYDRKLQYRLDLDAVQRLVTHDATQQDDPAARHDASCPTAGSIVPQSSIDPAPQHEQYRRTTEDQTNENGSEEGDLSLNPSLPEADPPELIAQYEAMSADESYAPHLREMAHRRLDELRSRAASTKEVAA